MPVVEFHLLAGQADAAQCERLLVEGTARYAEVLASPPERVRAFITVREPHLVAVGGVPASRSGVHAPYVTCLMLQGRPVDQGPAALAALTDLLVEVLGVPRELVRGQVLWVAPQDWAIGGIPAAEVRAEEVQGRRRGGEPAAGG
jgi:phenylpyruvate tautomerase PptA (4-oxalocrotonate tautomerase family)